MYALFENLQMIEIGAKTESNPLALTISSFLSKTLTTRTIKMIHITNANSLVIVFYRARNVKKGTHNKGYAYYLFFPLPVAPENPTRWGSNGKIRSIKEKKDHKGEI